MIKVVLATFGLLLFKAGSGQQLNLDEFNRQKQKINKKGLLILGSWSAANIIYGSIASSQTEGSAKYFNRMNALWNTVTLGLSSVGFLFAKKEGNLTYAQSLNRQASVEKVFLANAGLDVAYIAGGFYLKEKAKSSTENTDRNKGYGERIILQGSVLLFFDALMYSIHTNHGKQLYKIAEKVNLAVTKNGVGMVVKI